jgi:hypothetical protein
MRRGLVIGWMLGVATFALGVCVGTNWYEYRVVTPSSDVEWWIANDNCDVAAAGKVVYARCPRLKLP